MKKLLLFLLAGYKIVISPLLHMLLGQKSLCRYEISCSEYARQAIEKYGALKGTMFAISRFLSCQPFMKGTKQYAAI
jgi:putative membrane protein insertion efficiency factor